MAFSVKSKKSGKTYYLHVRKQERKGGGITELYYFAGTEGNNGDEVVQSLPEGREVAENSRTGLPLLKKKA
jgi:hypothetical protein